MRLLQELCDRLPTVAKRVGGDFKLVATVSSLTVPSRAVADLGPQGEVISAAMLLWRSLLRWSDNPQALELALQYIDLYPALSKFIRPGQSSSMATIASVMIDNFEVLCQNYHAYGDRIQWSSLMALATGFLWWLDEQEMHVSDCDTYESESAVTASLLHYLATYMLVDRGADGPSGAAGNANDHHRPHQEAILCCLRKPSIRVAFSIVADAAHKRASPESQLQSILPDCRHSPRRSIATNVVLGLLRWVCYTFEGCHMTAEIQTDVHELSSPLLQLLHEEYPGPQIVARDWPYQGEKRLQTVLGYYLLRVRQMCPTCRSVSLQQHSLAMALLQTHVCDAKLARGLLTKLVAHVQWVSLLAADAIETAPSVSQIDIQGMCKTLARVECVPARARLPLFAQCLTPDIEPPAALAGLQLLLILMASDSTYLYTCNNGKPLATADYWAMMACLLVNATVPLWRDGPVCQAVDRLVCMLHDKESKAGMVLDFCLCTKVGLQNFETVSALLDAVLKLFAEESFGSPTLQPFVLSFMRMDQTSELRKNVWQYSVAAHGSLFMVLDNFPVHTCSKLLEPAESDSTILQLQQQALATEAVSARSTQMSTAHSIPLKNTASLYMVAVHHLSRQLENGTVSWENQYLAASVRNDCDATTAGMILGAATY